MSRTFAHFNNSAIRRLRQAPSFLPTPLSYSPPSQTCARRDTHPVLSIVVPAYNLARYVEQCVRAILGQLREHHELIVIDDGSTDNTLALVTTLQQAWPGSNFHVKSQANEGIAGVRNHGVRAATGDYIVWIDGDDVLQGGILDKLDEVIARHRPDVIVCDYTMWHPQEPAKTHPVSFSYPDNVMLRDADAILTRFFACRKNYIWATVFRRDIYAQLPGPVFPPGRVYEDVSTVPRLLSQCASLLYLPVPIIDYRQHPSSITQSISEASCIDFSFAMSVARRHLQARGVSDAVRRHFDITAGHFFLDTIKSTYYLPRAARKRVRESITASFIDNLFGNCESMLETSRSAATVSDNRRKDLRMVRHVRLVLAGNLFFRIAQSATRNLKLWRRTRKLRRHAAALKAAEGV